MSEATHPGVVVERLPGGLALVKCGDKLELVDLEMVEVELGDSVLIQAAVALARL